MDGTKQTSLEELSELQFRANLTVSGAMRMEDPKIRSLIIDHEVEKQTHWHYVEWISKLKELIHDKRKLKEYINDECKDEPL